MVLEGLKIENGFVREVKLEKFVLPIKVSVSELEELEKHISYLKKIMTVDNDGAYEWTRKELLDFLKDSTEGQKKLIKFTLESGRPSSSDIVKALSLGSSQAIAGLRAGFTARIKRDFGFKEKVLRSDWNVNNYENDYYINGKCIEVLKEFFN